MSKHTRNKGSMEAAKESKGLSILSTIQAPRFEDAGLEDCALSPKSIQDAFSKAANSIRSFITHDQDEEDHQTPKSKSKACVHDSNPSSPPDPCQNKKGGGLPDVIGDKVSVTGASDNGDDNLSSDNGVMDSKVSGNDDKEACVGELEGLKIDNGTRNVKD